MSFFFRSAVALAATALSIATLSPNRPAVSLPDLRGNPAPKIQVAILLDVSGSMNGLIEQAMAQLWNMVGVMGKAKCDGLAPQLEIALYEYGSPRNPAGGGFIRQITPLITDLDSLSMSLFGLKTDGGDEYCGQVIFRAVDELRWDTSAKSYKVIFIAGNEDFLQGKVQYQQACAEAARKGIIVNTIYCGNRMQGIQEHWDLGAACGGSFTYINPDAAVEDIPTPFDSSLVMLNTQLNGTYVGYGSRALSGAIAQVNTDQLNFRTNKSVALKRISVKGNKGLYNNSSWDLVDKADSTGRVNVRREELPDSLRKLNGDQLQNYIVAKRWKRDSVQSQINALSVQREAYLAEERKKRAATDVQTLETETEKLIRAQALRYNMQFD